MSNGAETGQGEGGDALWVARATTRNTESMAFGTTAGKALEALVDAWVERYCRLTDADPDHLWTIREDIILNQGSLGRGYVLGPTDQAWFGKAMAGDDPALSDAWHALAERHGIAAAPAP